MSLEYNKKMIPRAKSLRQPMTKQERRLWYDFLSGYFPRFQRQKTIGSYIVDFYCGSANLAIEIDGAPHFTQEGRNRDRARDAHFESIGLRVIRFTNDEIDNHFDTVCARINKELGFL